MFFTKPQGPSSQPIFWRFANFRDRFLQRWTKICGVVILTEEIIKKCVSKKTPGIGIESEWRSKWSIEWSAFAKMLSDTCYHKVLWFYKWQKFAQHSYLIFRWNFSRWFFAFAFNAKKLCNCHSVFFFFFFFLSLFLDRQPKAF